MLKIVQKRSETLEGHTQVTACCNADIDLIKVGHELLVRCRKCHIYIGNVIPREIALVEAHYGQLMKKALDDRKMSLVNPAEDLERMYPVYCNHVLKFAEQAARTTLRDFLSMPQP